MTKPRKKEEEKLCVQRLKALSELNRYRIVTELSKGPMMVGELGERLNIEQSLLSHHLKVLRDTKLVATRRDGKAIQYRIAYEQGFCEFEQGIDLGCCKLVYE